LCGILFDLMENFLKGCADSGETSRFPAPALPWFEADRFPVFLAPMAGFTDTVFRELCKTHGADVLTTEFVYADGLLREEAARPLWQTVDFTEQQRPMGVQIFGSNPQTMSEAAALIEERLRPDFIDLNFGCPASRVTCMFAGSSMLRDLSRLQAVVEAVVRAVPRTPVTAKIRLGWDAAHIVAREAGECIQAAGARALAIHGRTKEQGYRGEADWERIHEVATALQIPVVGNGSLRTAEDVLRVRRQKTVRGCMIGRAALGNPWLFGQIRAALEDREKPAPPTVPERWQTVLHYADAMLGEKERHQTGRWDTLAWMRPRIQAFLKDIPGARQLRNQLSRVSSLEDLRQLSATA
jgi:tRNA-dihydrouridine synthase B